MKPTEIIAFAVKYVNQPDRYPAWGSIKDDRGARVSVPADQVHLFSPGMTYNMEVELEQRADKTYRTFVGFVPDNSPPPQQPWNPPPAPPPAPATPMPVTSPVTTHNAPPVEHVTIDLKSEDMAVTGIIGRAFQGTGSVPDMHMLMSMMVSVRLAWRGSVKGAETQTEQGPPF